ncbi:MAG: flagellar hook capping protein [Campylobacterales bacterium]|nr:flagellar hook capping protein [Campylobacterales bacterium]
MAGEITSSFNTKVDNPTGGLTQSTGWTNPNGILGKDDFLKLLLVELKHQDPTSPMETDKMVSQTADLTVVESQETMKKSIESLAAQMKTTSSYSLVNSVGQLADTGNDKVQFKFRGEPTKFNIFFEEPPLAGKMVVYDSTGNSIKEISLTESQINKLALNTTQSFTWDGTDASGTPVDSGTYRIEVEYMGKNSKENKTTRPGIYPIESVKFANGEPEINLGDNGYVKLTDIKEIRKTVS